MEKRVNKWLKSKNVSQEYKEEIKSYDKDQKKEAFYKDLEFGTAGMRGVMGAGSNRINKHTIARASEGYALYINEHASKQKVAIAYDNRNNSKLYAEIAANVLAKHNIEVLVFKELMPTPLLSYAVRELDCGGGIVITASHNPKEYNGFKVYDERGCQLIPSLIEKVIENVNNIDNYLDIDLKISEDKKELIKTIDDSLVEKYIETILAYQKNKNTNKDFSLIYSPQHGTGTNIIPEVLNKAEYNCIPLASQSTVDGDFSNTLSPNPEDASAYVESIVLAKEQNANLVVTTDPDADRVGIAVKHDNDYVLLNGNETTAIILYYLISEADKKDKLSKDSLIINTVVTSDLGKKIAEGYNVRTLQTLTGFKYIGTLMDEDDNLENYIYGYEESYGSLPIPIVRDKDAVSATLLISEIAAYYDNKGMTLIDLLEEIYKTYGYFFDTQTSELLKGIDGSKKIKKIMKKFFETKIGEDDGLIIEKTENFKTLERKTAEKIENIDLDSAAVMKIYFKDLGWLAIRPSGTEPKIKFYYSAKGDSHESAKSNFKLMSNYVNNKLA